MANRLRELPDDGLQALFLCLLEDYKRTNDRWYLSEAEKVDEHIQTRSAQLHD